MEEEYKYQYHPNQCHLFFHHSSTIFPTLTHKTCFINKSKKNADFCFTLTSPRLYILYVCVYSTLFYYYYFLFSHCYAKYWKEWIKSIDDLTRLKEIYNLVTELMFA